MPWRILSILPLVAMLLVPPAWTQGPILKPSGGASGTSAWLKVDLLEDKGDYRKNLTLVAILLDTMVVVRLSFTIRSRWRSMNIRR